MMATVPHVTSGSGLRKFQDNGFLLDRVYICDLLSFKTSHESNTSNPNLPPHFINMHF